MFLFTLILNFSNKTFYIISTSKILLGFLYKSSSDVPATNNSKQKCGYLYKMYVVWLVDEEQFSSVAL
jgi:hypothetical protein